jgi:phosphate transport system permease protein
VNPLALWTVVWASVAFILAFGDAKRRAGGLPEGTYLVTPPKFYGFLSALFVVASIFVGSAFLRVLNVKTLMPSLESALCALVGMGLSWLIVRFEGHPRRLIEKASKGAFALAAAAAVIITGAIIFLLLRESWAFFQLVSLEEFLTGTVWAPEISLSKEMAAAGQYGALPLFCGSLLITLIALLVGGPLGLLVAIYTSQYASVKARRWVKPAIEVLAGIPTIVYGFFALAIVGPSLNRLGEMLGLPIAGESAFGAGLTMGLMILPIVSSLSDDALRAVPRALGENSLALGATRSETIKKVLIPAAMPGIIAAFLLAISRAVGETMLALMAVGLQANLTANPFTYVTTVTVQIVTILTGDQEFESAKTLSAFALALFLFTVTLFLNILALSVARWHYRRYDA